MTSKLFFENYNVNDRNVRTDTIFYLNKASNCAIKDESYFIVEYDSFNGSMTLKTIEDELPDIEGSLNVELWINNIAVDVEELNTPLTISNLTTFNSPELDTTYGTLPYDIQLVVHNDGLDVGCSFKREVPLIDTDSFELVYDSNVFTVVNHDTTFNRVDETLLTFVWYLNGTIIDNVGSNSITMYDNEIRLLSNTVDNVFKVKIANLGYKELGTINRTVVQGYVTFKVEQVLNLETMYYNFISNKEDNLNVMFFLDNVLLPNDHLQVVGNEHKTVTAVISDNNEYYDTNNFDALDYDRYIDMHSIELPENEFDKVYGSRLYNGFDSTYNRLINVDMPFLKRSSILRVNDDTKFIHNYNVDGFIPLVNIDTVLKTYVTRDADKKAGSVYFENEQFLGKDLAGRIYALSNDLLVTKNKVTEDIESSLDLTFGDYGLYFLNQDLSELNADVSTIDDLTDVTLIKNFNTDTEIVTRVQFSVTYSNNTDIKSKLFINIRRRNGTIVHRCGVEQIDNISHRVHYMNNRKSVVYFVQNTVQFNIPLYNHLDVTSFEIAFEKTNGSITLDELYITTRKVI